MREWPQNYPYIFINFNNFPLISFNQSHLYNLRQKIIHFITTEDGKKLVLQYSKFGVISLVNCANSDRANSKWIKVFKNGPSKICGRQPLKNMKSYHYKFFKGCLPQILLGPFLNALTQMFLIKLIHMVLAKFQLKLMIHNP